MPGQMARRRAWMASVALLGGLWAGMAAAQQQPPITIVVNQSPWFEGFRRSVELYEERTGNAVELDVNPFAGSLEKQRTAVRSAESPFDLLVINNGFYVEMYQGGFLRPLNEIDPEFRLDPEIYTFDDTVYWDLEANRATGEGGTLMTVPINPNIPLLYYRSDLYEENGLEVAETWDELLANAKALHDPPERYGIVQRGVRGAFDVTYDFLPYLWSMGGDFFRDQKAGDYTIVINSPESKAALDYYIRLAHEAGHPNTAGVSQSDVIQNLVTGKSAHAILVIAAWSQMDDPNKSAVPGQIAFAVPPHGPDFRPAPPLGHWLGGIPKNIPEERQRAALEFLRWFQTEEAQTAYAEGGSPPVRRDVLQSDMAKEERFRWMPALAQGLELARQTFFIPEAAEVVAVAEVHLNQAIAGEETSSEALNRMADEIAQIMRRGGYDAPTLEPLP